MTHRVITLSYSKKIIVIISMTIKTYAILVFSQLLASFYAVLYVKDTLHAFTDFQYFFVFFISKLILVGTLLCIIRLQRIRQNHFKQPAWLMRFLSVTVLSLLLPLLFLWHYLIDATQFVPVLLLVLNLLIFSLIFVILLFLS